MKVFANKKMKQFIIILVTVIMLFNVIAPAPLALQVQANEGGIVDAGGGMIVSILGKFTGALALAFQKLLNGVVNIASEFTAGQETETVDVFVSTIVYNQLPIIDANIFNPDTQNPLLQAGDGAGLSGIVKTWYSITRLMALAASLVILVYVAIKIILSSTGQSKAKYTELLKDWLLSLLLIFSLHYVLAAILFCSDAIVDFFKNIVDSGKNTFSYADLQSEVWGMNGMNPLIYSFVWLAFLGATFVFLILYIKRLILICFFVIISPIIVLLNTINKIRGKGADLLGNWLKEFVANVVMQPIDALMFTVVLSGISFCLALEPKQPLIALAFLFGYFPLRKWVLKYFEQEPSQNSQDAATGMVGKGFSTVGRGAIGAVGKVASNVKKIPQLAKDSTSNVAAIANRIGDRKKGQGTSNDNVKPTSYEPNKGWRGGYADLSPEMLERANAEMTGDTSQPSSYSNDGVNPQTSNLGDGKKDKQPGRGRKALGIGVRAAGVVAPKLVGAGVGLSAMALNVGAGNGMKGFKGAMNATETMMKIPGEFIEKNGGIKAIPATAATAIQYATDRVANSYIMTGEHGRYQKQLEIQQAWENEYEYMQDRFIATATEEQMVEFNSASNKQEYIMNQARQEVRSDPRYSNALEVYNGNAFKADNYILQKQKASWKNGQKKSSTNVVHKQGNSGTIKVNEHRNSDTIEVNEYGNSGTIEVHEYGNSGTIEVNEHGNGSTIEVHKQGNGSTIEVHKQGNGGTIEVHRQGNGGTIEVHRQEDSGTTVVNRQENNSVVNETVDNVEEADINRDLKDFIMDPKTEDLAYDLIEAMGEGDPLYEEYNRISDQAGKRDIALQFLFEKAKNNWSQRDLTDIVRGKKHQELQKLFKK